MDFELSCPECGTVRKLSAADQQKILASFKRLSQSETIECICHRYQFVLAARPIRAPRLSGRAA